MLQEGFENTVFPPSDWVVKSYNVYSPNKLAAWKADNNASNAHTGNKSACALYGEYSFVGYDTSILFTPLINFEAGSSYRITFFAKAGFYAIPRMDIYAASSQDLNSNLVFIGRINSVPGNAGPGYYTTYQLEQFTYQPSVSAKQAIGFMSIMRSTDANRWIDDIKIEKITVCTTSPIITTASGPDSACLGTSIHLDYDSVASNEKYQWQIADTNSANWIDLPGITSAKPQVIFTKAAKYRCRISCTGSNNWVSSNEITVQQKKVGCPCYGVPQAGVATGPATACAGSDIQLSCTFSGTGLSFQWQAFIDQNNNWSDIYNAKYSTVSVNHFASPRRYRCRIICDLSADTVYSNEVVVNDGCVYQNRCTKLVFPTGNQQLVTLYYDGSPSVPTASSNGVELKWRKGTSPLFVYLKAAGTASYENMTTVGAAHTGYKYTSDTSFIVPVAYNAKYYWFVSDVDESSPFGPPNSCSFLDSFTTAPPPPVCKPACFNVYYWDFHAFKCLISGSTNNQNAYQGFACQHFTAEANALPELMKGKSYQMQLWYEAWNPSFSAWIDFNDNGMFEGTERVMYKLIPYLPANFYEPTPVVATFNIPTGAASGVHRILVKEGDIENACQSSPSSAYGFVKIITSDNNFYGLSQAPVVNTCVDASSTTISPNANNHNDWISLVDATGKILASIKANGNNLGNVKVKLYQNSGPIRIRNSMSVLDRSVEIKPEFQPVSPVDVRIYFSQAEFDGLKAADPSITSLSDLGISKFTSGCGEQLAGYSYNGNTTTGSINGFHYIQFSTTTFSDFYIRLRAELLQPVHFLSVHAKRESGNTIISWETATEQNNQGFEVEYSKDGMAFKTLSFVASKANGGNSNAAISYRYVHVGSPVIAGYYRIKQIDKDGSARYSQVMSIYALTDKLVISKIFPNPATDKVLLQLNTSTPQDVQIQLSTFAGVVLKNSKLTLVTGQNKAEIVVTGLPAGVYLLTVKDDNGRKLEQAKISKW